MDSLKLAIQAYADRHANRDGMAMTSVPGLVVKRIYTPGVDFHAICRPLVVLVLQGAKRVIAGNEERVFSAGQSLIVCADLPIVSRVLQASQNEPYLAIAIELEMSLLCEVAAQLGEVRAKRPPETRTLFAVDTEAAALDCASRLMRLLDRPEAMPLLRPGIMRELHYWLLSGQHGAALRTLADSDTRASRIAAAIAILRAEYRSHIAVERLAAAAGMSLTGFYKQFKRSALLTPVQYQKRLRLIEARRLMLDKGVSASSAAFEVGYESVSQFTREYHRLFKAPPKRDAIRARSQSSGKEQVRQAETATFD